MAEAVERISVLDIFKIGIGPSSSHTMGPWLASLYFIKELSENNRLQSTSRFEVDLYGSLAKTGKGHGTDMAIMMGLSGEDPENVSVELVPEKVKNIESNKVLQLNGNQTIHFDPSKDIVYNKDTCLPFHPNGMIFHAIDDQGKHYKSTYYSIGGGFIYHDEKPLTSSITYQFPFPIDWAADLLKWTHEEDVSVSEIVLKNELSINSIESLRSELNSIWDVMLESIYKGCHTDGMLPGGLQVSRRASKFNKNLLINKKYTSRSEWIKNIRSGNYGFNDILKWVSCFALAVNEENASFGRVVTAPTNGAAGVIPAVLMHYLCFTEKAKENDKYKFLLTAGEIGSIFKKGSTISAAMGGCQAEIGVSSAMAAGALTDCMGGTSEQVIMAAEIAMEHHLGLTCDPVGGLVQIPCIERNSMGAVKAIMAAHMAMESDPDFAKVSLDHVIKTMWDTAQDMNSKYKETSDGGLAVNIPVNIADC